MNNTCPSCGAVYNVAAKDIGRKIKCKKCNTPLVVSDAGLVVDAPSAAAPFAAAAVADDFSMDDDAVPSPKGARKAARPARSSGGGLDAIGGVPTILFGLGTFLVIFFAFMPLIGEAATSRAKVGADKLSAERDAKILNLLPKGKKEADLTSDERTKYTDDRKKVSDDFEKRITEARDEANAVRISNVRAVWMERYGLMFGFLFLSFGCIGYLRSQQPLTLRIVAAVVLGGALLLIFVSSVGGGCGGRPPVG